MILFLDTSTTVCSLRLLINETENVIDEWDAGRRLSTELLSYLHDQLTQHQKTWNDISGIVVFRGPGSFTGLRIGHTVLNTLAHANSIPIIGEVGDDWQENGLRRLRAGEDDQLVMPLYGAGATITQPRK